MSKKAPPEKPKWLRWLFLCESILFASIATAMTLVAIEGYLGLNLFPGNAAWLWRPISSSPLVLIIYLAVVVALIGWSYRRFYLFKHPEKESRIRLL